MTLERMGGVAALVCAGTYILGFALLTTILAPLGYGTSNIDPHAVAASIDARPGILIAWNTAIYVVNALALAVLVVALSARLDLGNPQWASIAQAFGLIWATLVLGAGMIANTAVEVTASAYLIDPVKAAETWAILHTVELGLGGGNEIAGGVWILCVSLASLTRRTISKLACGIGLLTGLGGLATIVPMVGELAGAIFGLGAIFWFLAVARDLLKIVEQVSVASAMREETNH
ncbi:MAG: hypothetical protein AB8C46_22890 [Burkholderiaceae bacterium]